MKSDKGGTPLHSLSCEPNARVSEQKISKNTPLGVKYR